MPSISSYNAEHYSEEPILYSKWDHPIHPPKNDRDPWECEFLPDNGYVNKNPRITIKKSAFKKKYFWDNI